MARAEDATKGTAGNPDREDMQPSPDRGDTPREVGITTRDASGKDGDVPRVAPTPPPLPTDDRPSDGAPTTVEDFEPRKATPPNVSP